MRTIMTNQLLISGPVISDVVILFDRTLKPSIQDKILVSEENFVFTFRDGGSKFLMNFQ